MVDPPVAPRVLSGRYRLGELLGTGGSASVFAATDQHSGASIAIKVLHPHLSERPAARGAFLAEARRARPLRHPNIVGVLGVGVDESGEAPIAWIALERADGMTLSQHVAARGPLAPADAVVMIDGVLRALEAAHAIGLIHRDVSPSNVMVAPGDAGALDAAGVRLLDFGLADAAGTAALGTDDLLSVEAHGRAGVIGNVNYMSPEHVRGLPVDARGDVYQAGAVLFFALTGRPPFPRETTGRTMRAHLDTAPLAPSALRPGIPRGLDRIVVKAMLKDPGDRYPSAIAMRAAVAAVNPGAVDSGAPVPTASILALSASVPDTVTRVLGRTVVTAGANAAVSAATGRSRGARRPRSRAGTWLAATGGALAIGIVLALAATSAPITSIEANPSAAPSVSPTAIAPQPEPEPSTFEPVVSMMTVPALERLSVAEATRALADAGLVLGAVTLVDSPWPQDVVLGSEPAAGRRISARAPVALTVASGSNIIPEVAGQDRAAAVAALEAAGFMPSFATRSAPADTMPGLIMGTAPAAGVGLAVGGTVTILEAAPEPRRPTPTPTPTPSRPAPTSTPTPGAGDG
ncbi:protein kinase [Microbacterium sp. CFH 90308]|uniref:non-specific serine/threonine protein kinase n=1 Tax=Microbacterium salsuginis TaxID=2722803 RepID=A0ABX1KCF6_9MICO|nr:protein kinase [Microbacterium sp. CFH 90308]NLP84706.1 protein kinase [Microbacterium sp. CFH 90308]